jgi:single-strand DNA-binding protein
MAKSVNKVILLGTLGRDPELRYVANNSIPVVRISMATNQRFKDDRGNWQERTEWHSVVAWRRLAEIINEYVKKGDRLYVEGQLQTSSWDDQKTREKKYRTAIVVDDVILINGRNSNGNYAAAAGSADPTSHSAGDGKGVRFTDESIPF